MEEKPNSGLESLFSALDSSGIDVSKIMGGEEEDDYLTEAERAFMNEKVESDDGEDARAARGRGRRRAESEEAAAPEGGEADDERAQARARARRANRAGMSDNLPKVDFIENMAEWGKKRLIVAAVIAVLVLLAAYWWFHPPINVHSSDTWLAVIIVLIPIWLFLQVKHRTYAKGTKKTEKNEGKAKTFKIASYLPILVCAIFLVGSVASLSLFPGNAAKYASILKIQNEDFVTDIQEVNYSEIPIIDRSTAVLLGNKEMGTIPEYVSQFEINPLYSQINYKNTPVRVSPLGYADLFKWLMNRGDGLPAYALVDMTTQNAQIVSLGEGQGIKYSASEPLARNIDRYVQLKYPFYMFDEKSFAIDEDGHPWWICPVQDRTIGLFGGTTIYRVVLCDAVSGECVDYAVEEVPQWVDHVYPAELIIQQYNWYGSLLNGWFNSWLGQSGVTQTTPGTSSQLGYNYIAKDDDVWVYTGVTSVTSDSSIIGFMLVNQRTQEAHFYSVAGATEASAMSSAEGQVQHLRYTATFPILINVANQPTYFMALKDGEGLVKKFAMVDIKSYQLVAIGDSVAECQSNYVNLLASNGIDTSSSQEAVVGTKVSGAIDRLVNIVLDGNTHFYMTIVDDTNLFDVPVAAMPQIVTYKEGDTISFTFIDGVSPYTVQSID